MRWLASGALMESPARRLSGNAGHCHRDCSSGSNLSPYSLFPAPDKKARAELGVGGHAVVAADCSHDPGVAEAF